VFDRVECLLLRLGKRPSRVGDDAGFVGNRIQFAMFREACLIVEEGLATIDEVDDVVRYSFGWRLPFLGPFLVADLAGLDVYEEVYRTMCERFGERFAVPAGLAALVADGKLGVKSGQGFRRLDQERAERIAASRDRAYDALGEVVDAFQAEADG
jgi:3-hydroxybutyryl-CoA dehydrogenase